MKKYICIVLTAVLCLTAFVSCSADTAEGQEGFLTVSVIPELFCAYGESVLKNIYKPSADAEANAEARYSYESEDGPVTDVMPVKAVFDKDTGAFSVDFDGHTAVLDSAPVSDGKLIRDITKKDRIQRIFDVFIKAFCKETKDSDYETAPDSIRASDDDVEVSRITLKLDKSRYAPYFRAAAEALKADAECMQTISDIAEFYAYMHGYVYDGGDAAKVLDGIVASLEADGEQLVWQRYIRNGKTVAARLKAGDNLIRYLCAETDAYTELDLEACLAGNTVKLSYTARRTGMSDTYNVRLAEGDRITYFDGTAESAYKSGNIKFDLRATKNEKTVNGFTLQINFNAVSAPVYKCSGSAVRNGGKTTYECELGFEKTDGVEIQPPEGDTGICDAVRSLSGQ